MQRSNRFEDALTPEGRYRLLVEAVTDYAIYMLDPEGRVTSWNPGAQRFKGYTHDEIIGRHFSQFYGEEDRKAGLPARALEISAREGKFENEGWRIRKDGSRFWAHVVIDPIRSPDGRLVGFAKITRDLTERKAAQDRLRQKEEQFRLLVQSVTDYALYMLDPEGYVSSWNQGAERIKQYRTEEIIGQHFSKFYTEGDRLKGEPQNALATARREGRFEKEGWRVRKDGTQFWANIIIDPIRDETGAIIGFAKITRDITERRETQKALEHAREALAHSQKMDAIGQLTGGIAHDFNNLLMVILGSLELAGKRLPDDARVATLISNATQAAQRGAALTQRMLAFARRQDLDLKPIDIPALVRGMTDLLQSSLGPSVQIETHFPLKLDLVHADANQLEMALLNLAVNARDAMPDGGSIVIAAREETVKPRSRSKLKAGRYVRLSVKDTGEGMDKTTLRRAMEPFFTTKGVGRGTGLGLSMVHGMTEQSGGRFFLKSQKGEGTTAEIWLPAAKATQPAQGGRFIKDGATGTRPLVVLAVDDDGLVLMNTAVMLQDMGHTVFEATSGDQALEILRREPSVDLVITDHAMPRMTGAQLAAAIKAERPDLPVILATGYAELPPGVDANLPKLGKPFRQQELMQAVTAAIAT
ncbi:MULTISPECIES: PAS domain-containing sensor histidine kinase [unclassified Afipia]|uniref:hybrid sensor histidine kinase/response regulator n=1 Tax=unclassified Afipia TaxID=2642050 RepID=UPI0004644A40|nr:MULTISPECIES: PAS domain-containing sensor histidine kinase [unclassified Afipia]MAH68124.1 PAS domain-containing sensor histidine kinase [Afipia sp.]OUX62766.1 MAG: hybrid sensor histidine kinase/response regulator [Afipia sp. TMED4]HAO40120.1 PAS domain-containing sensor histidine kinase [Afipia sp.]HAP10324.1 PAS domain-containing sensor histidine kinase [Afipia sp.]HAP47356.1 PAS domain-containing sensor histidine kinase [Afipia sp.]